MTSVADADWYVDPLNRFDGRFFDGDKWTNQVSSDGVLRIDEDWPEPVAQAPKLERPNRRTDGDRRQVNLLRAGQPERRRGDRRQRAIVIPTADD